MIDVCSNSYIKNPNYSLCDLYQKVLSKLNLLKIHNHLWHVKQAHNYTTYALFL